MKVGSATEQLGDRIDPPCIEGLADL